MDHANAKALADLLPKPMDEDAFYAYHSCEWLHPLRHLRTRSQHIVRRLRSVVAGITLRGLPKHDQA